MHFDPNPADRARPGSTLDSRQAKVVERLELIGQGPARFFRDACRVMNGEVVLDAATHTVAHYLREIDSAIRKVLEPMVSQERQAEIKAMKKGSHQAWIEEMAVVLGFLDPETVAARWTGVAGQLHDLAHRDALAPPRPIDDAFRRLWDEAQEIYELLSRQFASSFLATMPLIDALAAKAAPGETDASALRNTVPQSVVALDRFFGQLDSPAWLEPLRSHTDYFTAPTALSRGDDGSATYTPWPPGQYLVRMAALESERAKVIEIAIALETDNPEAHERVTEAALAMPPVDAARLVEKIEKPSARSRNRTPPSFLNSSRSSRHGDTRSSIDSRSTCSTVTRTAADR